MTIARPNAQTRTIQELFSNKTFHVPSYQRTYAWEQKNWADFWSDIKDGIAGETEHYWGTLTLKATTGREEDPKNDRIFQIYEVVDGQQRITTIFLFLLALSRTGKPNLFDQYIKSGNVHRLVLGNLNGSFLQTLVDNGEAHQSARLRTNERISAGLQYFVDQLNAYGAEHTGDVARFVQLSTFALEFVVEDESLAIKAFESLNDRGKPLTLLERAKSYLMFQSQRYLKGSLNAKINSSFGEIFTHYDLIKDAGTSNEIDYVKRGKFTENELLRFFYHYFARDADTTYNLLFGYDYDTTVEDVFDVFLKDACTSLQGKSGSFAKFVEEFVTQFKVFSSAFQRIVERTASVPSYTRLFRFLGPNANIYPLLIGLETRGFLDAEMLSAVETLDIRVYKAARKSSRAELYRGAVAAVRTATSAAAMLNQITAFTKNQAPDDWFRFNLQQPIYENPGVKYMLWAYEKHQSPHFNDVDVALFGDLQIDHAFPTGTSVEMPGFGFTTEQEYQVEKDKVGNLRLLEEPLNKSAGKLMPKSKAGHYKKSAISSTTALGHWLDNHTLGRKDVDARMTDFVTFAVQRWPVP